MTYPINLTSPTTLTTSVLIADEVATPNGSVDSIGYLSLVSPSLLPVSAALEVQSTKGAVLVPRMTSTQITNLTNSTSVATDGMIVYDNTNDVFKFRQAGSFINPSAGPGSSTDNAIVRWTGSKNLNNSGTILSDTNNITGALSMTLGVASTSLGTLVLRNATNANTTTLRAGATASNLTFTLNDPAVATANAPMITSGGGEISESQSTIRLGIPSSGTGSFLLRNGANAFTITAQSGVSTENCSFTLPTATPTNNANLTAAYGVPLSASESQIIPIADDMGFSNSTITAGTTSVIASLNIAGMYADPTLVPLIPAPGAGFAIIIRKMYLRFVGTSVAYTGGGAVYAQYGTGGAGTGIVATSTIAAAFMTANALQSITVDGLSASQFNTSDIENQAIYLSNATGGFGTGDGTIKISIWYSTINVGS